MFIYRQNCYGWRGGGKWEYDWRDVGEEGLLKGLLLNRGFWGVDDVLRCSNWEVYVKVEEEPREERQVRCMVFVLVA